MSNPSSPRYSYWRHTTGATASFPTGDGSGGSTGTAASSQTGPGKRCVIRWIMPQTTGAGVGITIVKGGGLIYFTWPRPGNSNGANTHLHIELFDGLGITSGAGEDWLIAYELIG